MKFLEINENFTNEEILKTIENNITTASIIRREIEKLTQFKKVETKTIIEDEEKSKIIDDGVHLEVDDDFEDMVLYYLEDYKNYLENVTINGLLEILPSKNNYRYHEIFMRLQAESIKEIKELEELSILEDDKEVLYEIRKSIICEKEKIRCLKEIISNEDKEAILSTNKNKILLVPNLSGKIMILDDLEHIPQEYYNLFLELINSIIDNSFKGVKRMNGDSGFGVSICEVRSYAARILFHRLNENTYAIISAFIKKTNTSHGYKEYVRNKIAVYRNVMDFIKESMSDMDFINENENNIFKLYSLLQKGESKICKLGGLDD